MPALVLLAKHHNRRAFRCGVESLDRYLHQQAGQDSRRHLAAVYVLEGDHDDHDQEPQSKEYQGKEHQGKEHQGHVSQNKIIQGYYTLSAYGIQSEAFPPEIQKHCPRYSLMPAYLLGRLAVDERYQGQGLGQTLLVSALKHCVEQRQSIAAMAVVVDALNDEAARFYQHFHFQRFPNTPDKLFITMKLLVKLFGA